MPASIPQRLPILGILLFALVLRLAWVIHLPAAESSLSNLPDQLEYLSLGKNLLHQHQLEFFDARFNQAVWAYRTPGYPAFVAACGANLRSIRIAQCILDTSTVLAIYFLASRWLGNRACLLAALLVAIDPFLIYFTGLILSETLFIAMLAWGIALLVRRRNIPLKIFGALILAAGVLVRPSALILPAVVIAGEDFVNGQPKKSNRLWHVMLSAIFGFVLTIIILLPWAIRNQRVLGRTIWTSTDAGITAYDGFNPQANGSSNQNFVQTMPELQSMNEVERNTYLSGLARRYAIDHPVRAVGLAILKIARTWSPIPLSEEFGSRRLYVVAAACWSIPLDLLFLWGLWRGSLGRSAKVYCLLPAIYLTIVHAISVGSLRYRLPAEVIMCVVVASCQLRVARKDNADSSLATGN